MTEENDRRDVADVDINAALERLRIAQQTPEGAAPASPVHPKYDAVTELTEGLARTLLKMQNDLELALGRIDYIEQFYCEDCECKTILG